ncbi:hypothetical protein GCM10020229_73060 [Kitasatospora albolonga]
MTQQADDSPSGTAADGESTVRGDVLSSTTTGGRRPRRGPVALFALVARQFRRPFHRVVALYRRSIQVRVVAATLLLSLAVVLVLGVVVVAQVRTVLLDAKKHSAQNQARGGFEIEQDKINDAINLQATVGANTDPTRVKTSTWLIKQVSDLATGGSGVYSVIALVPNSDEVQSSSSAALRGAYGSGEILPASISPALRAQVAANPGQMFEQTAEVQRATAPGKAPKEEPGLIIGQQFRGPDGTTQYQLYYVFSFAQETSSLGQVTGTLATAGVFVVMLLGGIAWLVVRQVVTPVRMVAGISERLAAGHLEERMKVTGSDDIARLGESFNRMANALQAQIRQLEELSRVQRRFVSDVSHELRTPLTTVRMAADLIYDSRDDLDPMAARSAELLQGQLDRFESLLADLLEISRFDAGAAILDAEPVDLRDIVGRVVEAADPLAQAKGSAVIIRGGEEPVVAEVDSRRIERILRNLVVNALEHGEGRDVVIRLGSAEGAGRGRRPGLRHRAQARRGLPGVPPLLAGRPVPGADHRRHGPGPVDRGRGRAPARRLAAGLGRAGRRLALPAHPAAHPRRGDQPGAVPAGAGGLPAQPGTGQRGPVPAGQAGRGDRAHLGRADGGGPGDAGGPGHGLRPRAGRRAEHRTRAGQDAVGPGGRPLGRPGRFGGVRCDRRTRGGGPVGGQAGGRAVGRRGCRWERLGGGAACGGRTGLTGGCSARSARCSPRWWPRAASRCPRTARRSGSAARRPPLRRTSRCGSTRRLRTLGTIRRSCSPASWTRPTPTRRPTRQPSST